MCVLSIELVLVEIYGKMGENPPFMGIFEVWYRYQTVWYQYHMCFGRLVPVPKSRYCLPNVLFWTSISVLAIMWSFLVRIERFKLLSKLDFKENKSS